MKVQVSLFVFTVFTLFILAISDYMNIQLPITFLPDDSASRIMCNNISLVMDELVENMEEFLITLSTLDDAVNIVQRNATVALIDSSSK